MTSPNLRSICWLCCWLCCFKCAYACFCIHTSVMPTLEVMPAYTVKEVRSLNCFYYILFSAYACIYCPRSLNCFYNVNCLVVVPAYTVKEVSTASTILILFSDYACFYCQRSLNCFYNAYTV